MTSHGLPGLWSDSHTHTHTYMAVVPLGQIQLVGEEIPHAPLLHLFLQHLQEVGKPFKGVRFSAEPIEVDLKPGSRCRHVKQ